MEVEIRAVLLSALASYLISNYMYNKNITRENRKRRYFNLYTPLIKMVNKYKTPEFSLKEETIQEFVDFMNDHIELLDRDLWKYRKNFISYLEEQQYTINYNEDYQAYNFIECVENNYCILRKQIDMDKL